MKKYNSRNRRPQRETVLILSYPDGYQEVFAERHVDVHLVRVPVTNSPEGEQIADDVIEMMLPWRYRSLYRADRLRATGTTRPLLPSVMARAMANTEAISTLNELASQSAGEEVVWTI